MNACPHAKLRSDLPPLTARIAALPIDPDRGYPVPFFVTWLDGKPEFRLADSEKYARCVNQSLCWVCGQKLGAFKAFVIGPMCTVNRISGDPPSHKDCAEWSVRGCPFLVRPQMVRREDELTQQNEVNVPGVMIKRNPGVMAIWITRSFQLVRDHGTGRLFQLGDPEEISWWREGRHATRAEILEGIKTGLPALESMCDCQAAHDALKTATNRAMKLLPEAA